MISLSQKTDSHLTFEDNLDIVTAFDNTMRNIEALAWLLSDALDNSNMSEVSTGIHNLFRRETEDLRAVFNAVSAELDEAEARKKLIEDAMVAADLTSDAAREKIERAMDASARREPPKASPTAMRDKFVMEAHGEGHSSADISMALGLPQGAVLRIIGRLAGSEQERRKAV